MAEDSAALLAKLARAAADDIDLEGLLDAVLLAAVRPPAEQDADGSASAGGTDDTAQHQKDTAASAHGDRRLDGTRAIGSSREPAASVWLKEQGTDRVPGKQVSMGRATALPHAQDIGRALRPFRRPWLSGVRRRLDVDATVEHYTLTGMLIPQLAPAPEPWLEAIVVLDRGTAMAVWDETVRAFVKLLRALAAFRDVRVWHLEHASDGSILRDHHGRCVPMDPDAAQPPPARRLLLVVSDCAAPAWRQEALWRTLHTWSRTAPVALINPLPKRLWQRSGLDLPRTIATAPKPASPGRLLAYRRPRLLRESVGTKPWLALPVLELAPDQVLAWARTLMRTDPNGCEAVLVPATGRPPVRRLHRGPARQNPTPVDEQVRARAEAFADDRESNAVRLAVAAAPLGSFTLPVLDVLRERLVPEATLADTAEFLTAGLLTATPRPSADTLYRFHPAAADYLTNLLTRDQLWETHFALSDHLAAHLQVPHGIPVVFYSPDAEDMLTTSARPLAYAAAATARLLGIEATETMPTTRRGSSTDLTTPSAETSPTPQRSTASTAAEMRDTQASEVYATLARLFRSLLAKASEAHAFRPDEPGQQEALEDVVGVDPQDKRGEPAEQDDETDLTDGGRRAGLTQSSIPRLEQVLADRERSLGSDHPDTLASRDNLANALYAMGRHQEAAELFQRNLTDYERILGPDHPYTLTSRNNLARVQAAAARTR